MNENNFTLGDIAFVRDVKTGRCYRLDENGKKIRISNIDYEEYLLEAKRRLLQEQEDVAEPAQETVAQNKEKPEPVATPAGEAKVVGVGAQGMQNGEFDMDCINIAVKANDSYALIADKLKRILPLGKMIVLSGAGVRAIANAVRAIKTAEATMHQQIPCFLNHRKVCSFERQQEMDVIYFVIYPELVYGQQQNLCSLVTLNKISVLCMEWRKILEKKASTDGADEAEENQLVFPWIGESKGDKS